MPKFSPANSNCSDECLVVRAFGGLSVGLVLLDAQNKVLWMNRAAEHLLGEPAAQCVGRSIELILKDPRLSAFWQDSAGRDGDRYGEISVQWPKAMELKINVSECLDGDDQLLARALLICDITHERTVRVELSQAVANRLLALTSGHMPPEPVANLTQQELRMLRLVGRGLSNEDIADQTDVSASTVRSHLKSMYRKLHIGSRAEAVSFAVRHHLV